jgi:hypothetical protein
MEYKTLLMELHIGNKPDNFDGFDPLHEIKLVEDVNTQLTELAKLVGSKENIQHAIRLITRLQTLDNYNKLLSHTVHINEFKDKYNNVFLHARTTIKDKLGKTKWVSAYVGTLKDYPKGVNDVEAIKKGQILIRQKIKGYFGIQ